MRRLHGARGGVCVRRRDRRSVQGGAGVQCDSLPRGLLRCQRGLSAGHSEWRLRARRRALHSMSDRTELHWRGVRIGLQRGDLSDRMLPTCTVGERGNVLARQSR